MSKEKSENAISEKENTSVAVPSAFIEDANSGLETLTAEDITIPRLKVLQAMSPEVMKSDGKYVEGASAGDIINTVTGKLYTNDNPLVALPVAYKRLFLEWGPRESGGGLVAQHEDASILSKTTKDNMGRDMLENGNYIQTSATHFVLSLNEDGSYDSAMIAMAGTQLKKSRTWNSVMASIKMRSGDKVFTPASFSHKYVMKTKAESNDRGTWFGWNITLDGPLGEDEMFFYQAAKDFASTVGEVNLSQSNDNESTSEAPF
jgi:hypothetical protein|tara:strand:- start:875 stop:1657 length:783 start_codon:yes stop_codon:yes gene_type:complete